MAKLAVLLDTGKEKMREENFIKEESKKEISLYKYNRESKNGNAGENFFLHCQN